MSSYKVGQCIESVEFKATVAAIEDIKPIGKKRPIGDKHSLHMYDDSILKAVFGFIY